METDESSPNSKYDLSHLQKFLNEENYQKVKHALSISDKIGMYSIDRDAPSECQVGCQFSLHHNKALHPQLQFNPEHISTIQLPKKLNIKTITPIAANSTELHFVYEIEEEGFYKLNSVIQKNIIESCCAHFVHTKIKGFKAILCLQSLDENLQDLQDVMNLICAENEVDDTFLKAGITYSVSGKLPGNFLCCEKEVLNKERLQSLRCLHDQHMFDQIHEASILKAGILPFDLDLYFSPLLEKLCDIQETFLDSEFSKFKSIIDLIFHLVLERILTTSKLIKKGQNYESETKFLQIIAVSSILDKNELLNLCKTFQESVNREICDLGYSVDSVHQEHEMLTLDVVIHLSIGQSIQDLLEIIKRQFDANSIENLESTMEDSFSANMKIIGQKIGSDVSKMKIQSGHLLDSNPEIKILSNLTVCVEGDARGCEDRIHQFQLMKNGVPLEIEPPIFDEPQEFMAEEMGDTSVKISFKLTESAKSLAKSYRVIYRTLNDHRKNSREEITSLSFSPDEVESHDNSISMSFEILEKGLYLFRVQVVYEEICGVFSSWSDPITVFGESPQILTELEGHLQSIKCSSIQRNPNIKDKCEIGHIFDIDQNKSLFSILKSESVDSAEKEISPKLSVESFKDDQESSAVIKFLYRDYEEILEDLESSIIQKNISDTTCAHYIVSRVMGYRAEVCLKFDENSQEEFESILQRVCKSDTSNSHDIPDGISFSITGAIPEIDVVEVEEELHEDDLEEISKFHDEETFENMESPFPLSVTLDPFDLKSYFQPLIDKLSDFKKNILDGKNLILRNMTEFISELVIEKIKETSVQIRDGLHYIPNTTFLQKLLKSYFLDFELLKTVVNGFQDKITKQLSSLDGLIARNTDSTSAIKEKFTLQYHLNLSAKTSLDEINTKIRDNFTQKELKLSNRQLLKDFEKSIRTESEALLTDFLFKKDQLSCLTDRDQRQRMNIEYSTAISNLEEDSGVVIQFLENGSPLSPQPPLLETPKIIKVETVNSDSVSITWRLSDEARRALTGHRIRQIMVQDNETNSQRETTVNNWENLTRDENCVSFTIKGLERGIFVFQIQLIYGELLGVSSDPSEPICTNDFSKSNESAKSDLKFLTEDHEYEKLVAALDTSALSQSDQEHFPLNPCEVGWLYDPARNKAEKQKLPMREFMLTISPVEKKIKIIPSVDVKENKQKKILNFTFEDYVESLNHIGFLLPKTIEDTTSVYLIASQVKGFEAIITLTSVKGEERQLPEVLKLIRDNGNVGKLVLKKPLKFSISGKLPNQNHVKEKSLTVEDVKLLQDFHKEKIFDEMSDRRTLSVRLIPLNLVHYYSPIFTRLVALKSTFSGNKSEFIFNMVNLIISETLKKIKMTADLIKSNGDCSRQNEFLQTLLKSVLLNPNEIDKLIQEFKTLIAQEKKSIQTSDNVGGQDKSTNESNTSALFIVNISLTTPLQNVKTEISQIFGLSETQNSKNRLLTVFRKGLIDEVRILTIKLNDFRQKLISISDGHNKQDFKFIYQISSNFDESSAQVIVVKNDRVLEPQPPIFDPPVSVKATKVTGDSVALSWSIHEVTKNMATSFQIDLKRTSPDDQMSANANSSSLNNWQKISTCDTQCTTRISNLSPGSYRFRVRAVYEDIPGMFLELAEPITISEVNDVDERENVSSNFPVPHKFSPDALWEGLSEEDISCAIRFLEERRQWHFKKIDQFRDFCQLGDLFDYQSRKVLQNRYPAPMIPIQKLTSDPLMLVDEGEDSGCVFKNILWINYSQVFELKSDNFPQVSIKQSSVPYVVWGIRSGNWVNLKLSTDKKNRFLLDDIFNTIQDKINEERKSTWRSISQWFSPGFWFQTFWDLLTKQLKTHSGNPSKMISYSISSNCTKIQNVQGGHPLDKTGIEFLRKLDILSIIRKETRYSPLLVEITPVFLELFFQPLLEKMKELKMEAADHGNDVKSFVNFIEYQLMKKITETAERIKKFDHCKSFCEFLRQILQSTLLQFSNIKDLIKSFDELKMNCELLCQNSQQDCGTSDPNRSIKVEFEFGIKICSIGHLLNSVEKCFVDNNISQDCVSMKKKIEQDFEEKKNFISQEMKRIIRLKDSNKERNHEINYEIVFSKDTETPVNMRVFKHGVLVNQKMALLYEIQDIKASQTTKNSITLNWSPVDNNVRHYEIYYMKISSGGESNWQSVRTDHVFKTVDQISGGQYVFKVQAVYDDISGICSQETEPMSTRICLAEEIVKELTPIGKTKNGVGPEIYSLPLKEKIVDEKLKLRTCTFKRNYKKTPLCKTIILLGATGSGKSTFINGLINYVFNVDWTDDFRFKIITVKKEEDNKAQALSQTEWITNYHVCSTHGSRINYNLNIIDTPGFGDTGGIQRDFQIFEQIKQFFEKKIQILHAICIVIPNTSLRLTQAQKYIFDTILSIFGNDIKDNIFILVTFADTPEPPVIDTLRVAEVPFSCFFPFNNSALYVNNQGGTFQFTKMFWDLGTVSFADFVDKLDKTQPVSLQLTKDVLKKREHIELCITNLQGHLKEGLCTLEAIRKHKVKIEENKAMLKDNENFSYEVDEPRVKKIDLAPGIHTTTCLICNRTCHLNCAYGDDADKRHCCAMNSNGYCGSCPKKCFWKEHKNVPYKFETEIVKVKGNYEEMKAKYGVAEKGLLGLQSLLKKMEDDYETKQKNVSEIIDDIRKMVNKLYEIALKPSSINLVEYIEMLIESEKQDQKPGYAERVSEYKKIQQRNELLKNIETDKEVGKKIWQRGFHK